MIVLDPKQPLSRRLHRIDTDIERLIVEHRPDVGSVETLFFHKDAQAAAKLGHARGVVLSTLARADVEVAEYAPAKVKRTVAGKGQADKRQVAMMVRALLGLDGLPPSDAADALAIAMTHLRLGPFGDAIRAAQAARPRSSPLPEALRPRSGRGRPRPRKGRRSATFSR